MKTFFLALLMFLTACGKEEARNLQLLLKLPATLSKSSGRYEAFLKTVEFMNVTVTREGESKDFRFPPEKWETLFISDLPKPNSKEKLEVKVEVWDRKTDGYRRSYPILKGQGSTKTEDLKVTLTAQTTLP